MNATTSIQLDNPYHDLKVFYSIASDYIWLIPTVLGVPGNIISILVANRKHNSHLSPCVYISAMAVADSVLLLQQAWFLMVIYWGLGANIKYGRDYIFK
jgi:hypothetical protein